MSLNEEKSDQQPENMEEEIKMDVEEASINLGRVKKEFDESDEHDFDENRYRMALNFNNIFGDSSKEIRDNKDSLIGFLDDEVVMETGCIKLEDIKDEDDLIREIMEQSDCNKCGGIYEGYCPDCSSLSHILNNLTPNINSDTILNTVPINMLEVKEISTRQAVFALKTLPKGLILGPFEGVAPIESTTGLQWKIKDKKLVHDQNGNWMQYIESVSNHASKNVDVFQFDGILYFETTRDIQEGEELLVCYREEKDEVVNKDNEEESYLILVKKEKYPRVYACTLCCLGFRLEKCLMEHKSKCQRDRGGSCEDFDVTQCRCCKVWLAKQEHLESHMLYCLNYNKSCSSLRQFQRADVGEVSQLDGGSESSRPNDGIACDLTEAEIIRNKRSCAIKRRTRIKFQFNTEEKKCKCSKCSYKTNDKSNLNRHFKKHSSAGEYKCSGCSYRTNYEYNLKRHLTKHSGVKALDCDICKNKFSQKQNLKVHINNQHSSTMEKECKCSECLYRANYKETLDSHIIIAHCVIKAFECDSCKKKFGKKKYLKNHIKNQHSNTKKKEYKCSECSYQTNQKGHLRTHLMKHSGVKAFECDVCRKKFKQISSMKRHIKTQHSGTKEKEYKCSECPYETNYKDVLDSHIIITHRGIRAFECEICKNKFSRKDDLKKHIKRKHSNAKENKYKCSKCSFETKYKGNFNRHSVTHNGVKSFECGICEKKYTQKQNLKTHIENKHLNRNEKKHKCTECLYQTNFKSNLKTLYPYPQ